MTLSKPVIPKNKRDHAATGKTPLVALRIPAPLSAQLDHWIGRQAEPRPSRSEAIRRLLAEALAKPNGTIAPSDASLDRQIAEQATTIAEMPELPDPSPEAGLATMDKALAENDLVDMKNERTRRKIVARKRGKPAA